MTFKRFARHGLLQALLWVCVCSPAWALFEDAEARRAILELRQSLKTQSEDTAQLRRALLELQGQIDGLKQELAKVRGERELLARELSELQLRARDAQAAVEERLRRFEPVKASVDGQEFMADPAEKREFEAALEALRKGDFAAARAAFARFVARYPSSGYEPSAQFWLGNALYALREYKDAQGPFRQLLQNQPTHARAAEAMLALSNVLIELKDSKAARKTLEDLVKAHPQSEAAQTAKERLAKMR